MTTCTSGNQKGTVLRKHAAAGCFDHSSKLANFQASTPFFDEEWRSFSCLTAHGAYADSGRLATSNVNALAIVDLNGTLVAAC